MRVTSGTALLVAFVPPSQPIISIGISTASHPVRKVKSGRFGRTAVIIRIMNARSPDESLMPITLGNSSARRRIVEMCIRDSSYTWSGTWDPSEESHVTVSLFEEPTGTTITLDHIGFHSDQSMQAHRSGWQSSLTKLRQLFATS